MTNVIINEFCAKTIFNKTFQKKFYFELELKFVIRWKFQEMLDILVAF